MKLIIIFTVLGINLNIFNCESVIENDLSTRASELQQDPKLNQSRTRNDLEEEKLDVSGPSINRLKEKIKIDGHKNYEKEKLIKSNMSNPSNTFLINEIKIDKKLVLNVKHNFSEPSVDKLDDLIKIDKKYNNDNKPIEAESSLNVLEKRFEKYDPLAINRLSIQKNIDIADKIEPSLNKLEKVIKIKFENKYEKKRTRIFLPGYESFHGEIVHNDQNYQHYLNSSDNSLEQKGANINDYKKWLEEEAKTSRLNRFKQLYEEFSKLGKKVHEHDFDDIEEDVNEKSILKLERAIIQIEQEEKAKKMKHQEL